MITGLRVLYEDNHCIAVYKEAGILVQGDSSGDESLMDKIKKYIGAKYSKPGNVFLGLVHRLDRNVSGIIVFAKTSKGASRLSEQFREHTVAKIYHALVYGQTRESARLINYLKKDDLRKSATVQDAALPGYDYSELEYRKIGGNNNYSLLKINLKTGRFHQIRAQLAHAGHPIVGDTKYGGKKNRYLGLCATELKFKSPTGDETINLKINQPSEWDELMSN